MIIKLFTEILILLTFAVLVFGQDPTPAPTPSVQSQIAQLQEQIELLNKQKEYEKAKRDLENARLNELLASIKPGGTVTGEKNQTTFSSSTQASAETAALSYAALKELSGEIAKALDASRYAALVIHNEQDFIALAKFRVYRIQSELALKNYRDWRTRLEDLASKSSGMAETPEKTKFRMFGALMTGLSLPKLATGFAGSVGELLSLFRTETIISESRDTVDNTSLGAALAHELKKEKPGLLVLYPGAFIPEYDVEADGTDTILIRISDVNIAFADVSEFLDRVKEVPDAERQKPPLKELIAEAESLHSQLKWLAVAREKVGGQANRSGGGDGENEKPAPMSDLRQLVRAEKLDRFMRQGKTVLGSASGNKVGILKVRALASGGSRRETRNLFLGNKIRYSGSVTLEVLLFDIDGLLHQSEIFSLHTGFRKLEK